MPERIHGRGAQSAAVPTRFGLAEREVDGDWRDHMQSLDGPPVKLRTTVTEERPKSILTFNQSPDVPFDRSINAYRGCEHGCIYCYARPSHAFHDLSPGLDFETKIMVKTRAPALLRAELSSPRWTPQNIAMSGVTDCYTYRHNRLRIKADRVVQVLHSVPTSGRIVFRPILRPRPIVGSRHCGDSFAGFVSRRARSGLTRGCRAAGSPN